MARDVEALENLRIAAVCHGNCQCQTTGTGPGTFICILCTQSVPCTVSHSLRCYTSTRLSLRPKVVVNAFFATSRFMHNLCSIIFNVKRSRGRQLSPEVVVPSEPPSVSSEFDNSTSYLSCIPDLTGQIIKPPRACWRERRFGNIYECTWNAPSGSSPVCTRQSAPTTNNDKHHRWQSSALGLGLRSISIDSRAK